MSDSDKDTLYLRGLEERGHHSLVIKRTTEAPAYERAGLRVFDEEALDRCKHTFEQHQLPCKWVEQPFQGRTLHAVDVCGTPLEICARMDRKPRLDMDVYKHKGAQARRFDHYQITISDIEKATRFYTSIGCRIADYITAGGHPIGVFLQMKDTPYDLVFLERDGPAFHHFGYIIPDIQAMLRACDTMGELGWNNNVEYGPGKHGVGHSYYVYILDPDGHRCELLLPPIVYMDRDDEPCMGRHHDRKRNRSVGFAASRVMVLASFDVQRRQSHRPPGGGESHDTGKVSPGRKIDADALRGAR